MKTLKFLLLLFVVSFAFISCDKNDPEDYDIFNVSVENGADYDIDYVYVKLIHYIEDNVYDTITVASVTYNGGNFKLHLPRKIDEKYLIDINKAYNPNAEQIFDTTGDVLWVKNAFQASDNTAKILYWWYSRVCIQAYKNNKHVGAIEIKYKIGSNLTYVNKPVIVTGEFEIPRFLDHVVSYNLNFNKGWSILKNERMTHDGFAEKYTINPTKTIECYYSPN